MCLTILRPKVKVGYQNVGGASFPFIGLALAKSPRAKRVRVTGLVDSGASISVVSQYVAELMGIKIDRGVKRKINTAGGVIVGYEHKLQAKIAKREFVLPAIISQELESGVNLIGRKGFFEEFRVCFVENQEKMILS